MHHDAPLISTIVAGLVLAFIFGAIANRFRLPPLVGYLIAGVAVGPFTPGFVADSDLANQLSEIGVILLMFGVGLHFSLKDLLSVRAIAIPGAVVQMSGATLLGLGLGLLMGWSVGAGLIFGLALSVASTVVLLKAMQDRRLMDSERGKVAVGWLIVEDIAMVLALVLIPSLAGAFGGTEAELHNPVIDTIQSIVGGELGIAGVLAVTVLKLVGFVAFMLIVGRRVIPYVLHATAHTGSRELFRLAVLAIALGVAAGAAYLFGVSLALGAFFAGMILSESELSHRAAQESLPLRDAFAVLFFVAVGMLFDPMILITQPLPVLATLFIILFGKSILAFLIVIAFGKPASMALTISASLAQIGEFSFILAALGVSLGILPDDARDLILGGAILSIVANPAIFWLGDRLAPFFGSPPAKPVEAPATVAEPVVTSTPTTLTGHTILIGFGRVGRVAAAGLKERGLSFVVIEDAEGAILAAEALGYEVIVGNAAADALAMANVPGATAVVIAIPNAFEAAQATEQCRKLNPAVRIVARAHSDEEEAYLGQLGADKVVMGEREIALGMLDWLDGAVRGTNTA
jgi:CPA2 family monovalent cation:H+ antiporter-2